LRSVRPYGRLFLRRERRVSRQLVISQKVLRLLVHLEQELSTLKPDILQQSEGPEHSFARGKVAEAECLWLARVEVHRALPFDDGAAAAEQLGDGLIVH